MKAPAAVRASMFSSATRRSASVCPALRSSTGRISSIRPSSSGSVGTGSSVFIAPISLLPDE